ncbi:DUF5641 domain-containing protein [Trichonephila clavipes]|nr:DUF5641 domain-containing protein [Trichonephila clavipes]
MKEAEIYLMKQVQLSSFYKEIRAMQNGDDICNKSNILNLSPFLDDKGIIRVGGRLKHSRLPYLSKHPILLPAKRNSKFSYEELLTLITQIEAILNSRPLTPLSSDVDDLEVLTPAHFLIGRPITAIVEPSLLQCESNRLNVWQRITKSVQTIWKRWSLSYLNSLQQRNRKDLVRHIIKTRDTHEQNDCLFHGVNLNPNILDLLISFRSNKIAVLADVEKAFLQISLAPKDRDVVRFLIDDGENGRCTDLIEFFLA